jgi:hypothetical protein
MQIFICLYSIEHCSSYTRVKIFLIKNSKFERLLERHISDINILLPQTISPAVSPQKLERSLSTSLSPRRLELKSPMEEKSPVKIPPKEEDMDMSSSSSSDEDSDEGTNVKYQPPVIKLSPPPKRFLWIVLF